MARLVTVGRVVRAHGIRGAVVARPASDGSDVLLHVESVLLGDRPAKVERASVLGRQVLLHFSGLADRNAAEALVGTELRLPEEALPPPAEGEFYERQLVGLEVVDANDGRRYGAVRELETSPLQVWLVVAHDGRDVLVPFTEGLVRVDLEAGRVLVDAPEGLFDGEPVGA